MIRQNSTWTQDEAESDTTTMLGMGKVKDRPSSVKHKTKLNNTTLLPGSPGLGLNSAVLEAGTVQKCLGCKGRRAPSTAPWPEKTLSCWNLDHGPSIRRVGGRRRLPRSRKRP